MKIHTEGTPNPNALKFVLDKVILEKSTLNYPNKESASNSPLALKLFAIDSVKEVFIGKDFITISKKTEVNWDLVYEKILDVINKHFESGDPVVSNESSLNTSSESLSDIEKKIHEILDTKIRPAVASDGGDIVFNSYTDGVLKVHLMGACSHCPSSIMTLKAGIESMLKREIPELKEVISV